MAENIPTLMTDTKTWIQETQKTPSGINTKKTEYHFQAAEEQTMNEILKEAMGSREMP